MIVAAVRHSVADYDRWKAAFDSFPPTANGALFARVNRALDDPNTIVVVCGFETAEAANGFLDNPELKAKMEEGGVTSEPRIELYEEVFLVEA